MENMAILASTFFFYGSWYLYSEDEPAFIFLFFLFFGISLVWMEYDFAIQKNEESNLLDWVIRNEVKIRAGGAKYHGYTLNMYNMITKYQVAISIGFMTSVLTTRYLIVGKDKRIMRNFIYSIYTAMFGWYCFPWGPKHTIKVLVNNLSGGDKKTIANLLEELNRYDIPR